MSEWQEIRVGELGRVVTGKTPPTSEEKYFNGGFKFVSPKDMDFDSRYIRSTLTSITHEAILKFKNQVIPKNTVMFTALSYGFGKIGLANESCLTNQQINSIIVNEKKYDFNFVYYLLRNSKDYFLTFNAGIVTPIVPKSTFENIKVLIPKHKETQQKIAKILSNYDDLIENNLKRIKLLEESARLTYEEWFLRFRIDGKKLEIDPESSLPFGWEFQNMYDLYEIKYGQNLPQTKIKELGVYEVYGASGFMGYHSQKNVSKKVALITSRGNGSSDIHRTYGESFVTNNSFIVRSKNKNLGLNFTLHHLETVGLINYCSGSAQPQLTNDAMKNIKIKLPDKELLIKFNNFAEPLIEVSDNLRNQNQLLKEARDILLPRLMTGMIDTDNMDIAV